MKIQNCESTKVQNRNIEIHKDTKKCKKMQKMKKHKKRNKQKKVQKYKKIGHQPLFELQTPDFAWKFVWIVQINYKSIKVQKRI